MKANYGAREKNRLQQKRRNTIDNVPLIILAFDAGDPDLMGRWAHEGHLPKLASIMEQGFWGKTSGPDLINEHGAFVSLFSGTSCREHGYYYSRQLRPGSYDLYTTTGLDADAVPFWSNLQGQNKRVAIIDVPDAFPIAGIPGVQLTDWANHNPRFAPSTEPPNLLKDVHRVFGKQMRISEQPEATPESDMKLYHRMLDRIAKKGALCRHLLKRKHFQLIVVCFSESHYGLHQFWPYQSQSSKGEFNEGELSNAIRNIYRAIDKEFGLLLKPYSDKANVFVVSSVGVQEQYPVIGLMENFCRQLGYQAAPEPGGISLKPMSIIRRLVPEPWRVAVSRNFSRQTRERLLAEQFRNNTNWSKTTAFAIPSSFTGLLRVNLKGREPEGVVQPGIEYESLLDQIAADFQDLVDPHTGDKAVSKVLRTTEYFGIGPPARLPDLFVIWKSSNRFIEKVIHPKVDLVQQKPEFYRGTHHSQNGFVAAMGPSIDALGAVGEVSLLDLAPTFLTLMEEPIPDQMTGKVIQLSPQHHE